jgi:hypothetical protein
LNVFQIIIRILSKIIAPNLVSIYLRNETIFVVYYEEII